MLSFLAQSQNRHLIQRHRTSISAAVALLGVYMLIKSITRIPRQLAHLPHLGFFEYMGAIVKRKTLADISSRLTLPVASQSDSGMYARFDRDGWTVHITQPAAAKKFLLKTDIFPKADRTPLLKTLLGRFTGIRHLVSLNGHEWKAQRKIANPAFHRTMPVAVFGRLGAKLFSMMDSLSEKGPIDFHDMTERWTLDVMGLVIYGFDFNAVNDTNSEWVKRYTTVMSGAFDPLYLMFPILDNLLLPFNARRMHQYDELQKLLKMLDHVIVSKRNAVKNGEYQHVDDSEKDLLTMMIEAEDAGEGIMSDEDLRSNVCLFFIAGHDTTANALASVIYELAVNQDVQTKAREEAIRVLGDAQEDVMPDDDQIRSMPYINMVMKENLRMHPPVAVLPVRQATEDTDLAGTFVPKGTKITLDIYELQHNPNVWKDPDTFQPERFETNGEAERLAGQGMTWLPFSNGSRMCIGSNFSLTEQKVLLPMLLRKYEWQLPENSIHKHGMVTKGLSIINPKDLHIVFKRRY
ncbi:cytochrome P450 [Lichtheimia hyalospora FSU 10163]|nr:cytochrome P450 [Lichtheimia hyalospora FSU 10163]